LCLEGQFDLFYCHNNHNKDSFYKTGMPHKNAKKDKKNKSKQKDSSKRKKCPAFGCSSGKYMWCNDVVGPVMEEVNRAKQLR